MNDTDRLTILDHLEIHDRGADRMAAKNGFVLYAFNGLTGVDDAGTIGLPLAHTRHVQRDLTSGDAPAPSERGHLAAHDGTGTPPAGLYESDPGNNQWSGIGLAAGNTISY